MADADLAQEIKDLDATLAGVESVLDLEGMRRDVRELSERSAAPDLWDDQDNAQRVTSRLSRVQGDLRHVEELRRRLDDLKAAVELGDVDLLAEAGRELPRLRKDIERLEVRTLLSGEYDERAALITINAQAGGTDAADFTEQLFRMYLRWAERHGYQTEVYDTSYAEEAGIKSVTFAVQAPYAYGTLRGEHGTHRLVRIGPFDNQGRRQTSFSGVDVVPVVEHSDDIDVPDEDIRVDVYRSSGPGGQGVNTTDSAVRITHLPTGIVVSCQNERSQIQNRATAMSVLEARLLDRRRQEEEDTLAALRGEQTNSWGTQIRNYVLHPYRVVKDLRTGVEKGNPEAVLDGDIDDFVEAEVRWLRRAERHGRSQRRETG